MRTLSISILSLTAAAVGQPEPRPDEPMRGRDGMRGPGPMMQEREIADRFDRDGDGKLSIAERSEARKFMQEENAGRPGRGRGPGVSGPDGGRPGGPGGPGGGPGGFGPPGMERPETGPGVHIDKGGVKPQSGGLYEEGVLRTIFLDFKTDDWESELSDFIKTDVEVPATMTVDGKEYPEVGVSFRGASSLMMVPAGAKRSFNISVDAGQKKQRLMGYKTLNLLNSSGDPSLMRAVLYFHIARGLTIPAPRANFVRVVVNGENWGLYQNVQQFDGTLIKEQFGSDKGGARWKVPGSPQARGGLEYLGDEIEPYRRKYTIKSEDKDKSWKSLIALCRTLNQTPTEKLEEALRPMLDVEGVLWFLALENALSNEDGYWIRSSDYSIYLDEKDVFHILPHDANEAFIPGGGGPRGRRGGPGGGPGFGPEQERGRPQPGGEGAPVNSPRTPGQVDPLIGLDDSTKPLRSKLLSVPALRASYLRKVRTIATQWLDWENLGPLVEANRVLIDKEVEADTRKLSSYESFKRALTGVPRQEEGRGRGRPSLEQFCRERREYLLNLPAVKELVAPNAPDAR